MTNTALLRWSLIAVWLGTAAVSLLELEGQSAQLLHAAGLSQPLLVQALIVSGAAADLALGLALWLRPKRTTYLAALALMLLMTLAATMLLPGLWLHPLGPLLKNLPIAALLWVLAQAPSTALNLDKSR
ncbi:DoxX-like family protein [Polaromonas naphthalenivorans]|uniref:NAD-dependent epimerase/dehydratase n=1 Tax=Polaromonas naphthalenivorans (strain CJ2) TaxID=365044 RepID=A1VMB6_POLNA|nr:DoxX-like family protein [Polaromonas naphthalenivorans]ABM36794.1 NAD-dependent epimerase/dehydratase [Polaromonas naphthalenivorans CJ2]